MADLSSDEQSNTFFCSGLFKVSHRRQNSSLPTNPSQNLWQNIAIHLALTTGAMQLLFLFLFHKWAVTISVILASSSRHEPEYLFILDLVNVEMGFPNRGCPLRLQRHGQKWRLFIEFYKVVQLRNFIPRFLTVPHRKIYQTNTNIWARKNCLNN